MPFDENAVYSRMNARAPAKRSEDSKTFGPHFDRASAALKRNARRRHTHKMRYTVVGLLVISCVLAAALAASHI